MVEYLGNRRCMSGLIVLALSLLFATDSFADIATTGAQVGRLVNDDAANYKSMEIFPLVTEHVHGPTIVELANGNLLAAWFQGSGERWADDVRIMGTRLQVGKDKWSEPFVMAISDDCGKKWKYSEPLVGPGNIQPSIAEKADGTLVAYMRDNGPAPQRLHVSISKDKGLTWSTVRDSDLPNPGSGADIVILLTFKIPVCPRPSSFRIVTYGPTRGNLLP